MESQFILNAIKYMTLCCMCDELTMRDKMHVLKIIYYDKTFIKELCPNCLAKLRISIK